MGKLLMISLYGVALAGAADPRTMRVDYLHSGSATEEHFALDRIALEGVWPGPLDRAIDETGLGKSRFEVRDKASGRLLHSAWLCYHLQRVSQAAVHQYAYAKQQTNFTETSP
jgi:hypothetical protein